MLNCRDHGSLSQNRPRIVRQQFISLKKKHFYTRCAGLSVYALLTLYVDSTIQRYPRQLFKTFLIEDFFHLPPVSTTLVGYSGAWRKLINEKTWSQNLIDDTGGKFATGVVDTGGAS